MENIQNSEKKVVDNNEKNKSEVNKEEGECSEDEEKSKDMKQISHNGLGDNRFLFEETTGMYYDQVTGYYYNLVSCNCFLFII